MLVLSHQAVASFESIQTFRPGDGEVPLMVARLFHRLKQPEKACLALEKHISSFPLAAKATHVNILAELYMEGKDHQKAAELMEQTASMISTDATLPIDILVGHAFLEFFLAIAQTHISCLLQMHRHLAQEWDLLVNSLS